MSSRTVLSASRNYYVALASGIFNQVYGSIGLASRFGLPVCRPAFTDHLAGEAQVGAGQSVEAGSVRI